MTIKMSDVFESKLTGQRLFKALDDCVTGGVKWLNQYTNAATAINAYDANQERIAELEVAFLKLIDLAGECDSWESFPSESLDDAYSVLEKSK